MSNSARRHSGDDERLLEAARGGDDDAFSQLYEKYVGEARAYASKVAGDSQAQDLVNEAFSRVWTKVRAGGGPGPDSFLWYLLAAIRNLNVSQLRKTGRETLMEDVGALPGMQVDDLAEQYAERSTVAEAFRSMPSRWQEVLWASAVMGEPVEEIADRLGLKPNAVHALQFRAREGLRLAYLREHVAGTHDPGCERAAELMPRAVRGGLRRAQRTWLEEHLATCDRCRASLEDLGQLNNRLAAVLAPALLGMAVLPKSGHAAIKVAAWSSLKVTASVAAASVIAGSTLWIGRPVFDNEGSDERPVSAAEQHHEDGARLPFAPVVPGSAGPSKAKKAKVVGASGERQPQARPPAEPRVNQGTQAKPVNKRLATPTAPSPGSSKTPPAPTASAPPVDVPPVDPVPDPRIASLSATSWWRQQRVESHVDVLALAEGEPATLVMTFTNVQWFSPDLRDAPGWTCHVVRFEPNRLAEVRCSASENSGSGAIGLDLGWAPNTSQVDINTELQVSSTVDADPSNNARSDRLDLP
ncbi:sigma-70 family RNA polymerase sigma factor [Nocardioides kongjuensis]|uniref:RNA polymerase sigma factor (Sigma-70 family) n=1 Tax=Nocardioides kongjuensis TaxID=349522 RepID=A0A852RP16_9ACTN|nr:sigma-70 family RNA polymerase sigma factor [Nocardioides kongjuensis]NYD32745.1 RNA polymerase sigma factor (sigma-70 family) [Nocardioides kongjuensis]